MLTKTQEKLKEVLTGLLDESLLKDDWAVGICWNADQYMIVYFRENDLRYLCPYHFVRLVSAQWPENEYETRSGKLQVDGYPIKFNEDCDKWEGTQLAKRQSLLRFLIDNVHLYDYDTLNQLEKEYSYD